jgi:hypothetical protein
MAKNDLKILLAGDSFSAKWPDGPSGWPQLLANEFRVTNVSQAGVGEYKILNQIKSQNLNKFDLVIVNHTSPFRVHTNNPIHSTKLHKDCDLIFKDVESNLNTNDEKVVTAFNWFKYHYDEQYQIDIYELMRKEIQSIIKIPYLAIDHSPTSYEQAFEDCHINFSNHWSFYRGLVNHYTEEGNKIVAQRIKEKLNEMGFKC